MLRFVRRAAICQALMLPTTSFANSCFWYADPSTIQQLTSDAQPAQSVSLSKVQALGMKGSGCEAWVLTPKQLLQYDATAKQIQVIELSSITRASASVRQMAISPRDGTVWLSDQKRVFHLTATGQLIRSWGVQSGAIETITVALDGSIWVLGNNQLWHYDVEGALITTFDLHKIGRTKPKFLMLDSLSNLIWLAGEKELIRIDFAKSQVAVKSINLPSPAIALALNPRNGDLWVTAGEDLLSYRRDGSQRRMVDLQTHGIQKVRQLAFDPVSRMLWVSGKDGLSRFSEQGDFISRVTAKEDIDALGVPTFTLAPTLSLVRPTQNGLTNSPQPTITYAFDTLCNDQPCEFADEYYSDNKLSATLNQQPIGPFAVDATSRQANYSPPTRLPEGQNTLVAQIRDRLNLVSESVTNQFTVDTIAPTFLGLGPEDGAQFPDSQVLIQGAVDDIEATIVVGGVGQAITSYSADALKFSYPFVLSPGLNNITVSAIDKAGNTNTRAIRLTYNQTPIGIFIDSPSDGAVLEGASVRVNGTFEAPVNTGITVNGIVATIEGRHFSADVPLQIGENKLAVTLTARTGATSSKIINVSSMGPREIEIGASPSSGFAPLNVRFEIENRVGRVIKRVEADLDGDGVTDVETNDPERPLEYIYPTPGIYDVRIKITDDQDVAVERLTSVSVQDPRAVEQLLKNQWSEMNAALVRGDKRQALSYLTSQAQSSYEPIFEKLLPYMPAVVGSYSPPQGLLLNSDIGEFGVNRTIDGVNHIFLVYFLLGEDGVWRLDAM